MEDITHPSSGPAPEPFFLPAALVYKQHGLAVFPVHTILHGQCGCGNPTCSNPGKHPRPPHGFKDATTDESRIRDWSTRWPDANIAIATGTVSGIVVLDIDLRHGGQASLDAWVRQYGPLPLTVRARSGSGGPHLYFVAPAVLLQSRAGVATGIDIRAEGGYIVAPPSRHISGGTYQWECPPDTTPLAPLPAWLLALLTTTLAHPRRTAPADDDTALILEGYRNTTLTSLAGTMRRRGMSVDEMAAALLVANERRCIPPLPEDEVVRIAQSIASYAVETSQDLRPPEEKWGLPHFTDVGNAKRLVQYFGQLLRYCHPSRTWYVFWDTHWGPDRTGEVERLAKVTIERIYDEEVLQVSEEYAKLVLTHAYRSEAFGRIRAMIALAASEPGIPVLPEDFDRDPFLFNVLNGTLDLRTGTLRAACPEDLLTKLVPVRYDPMATCPRWDAFLDQIMAGNQALIAYLQRAVGYALTGDTREQVLFLLYGTGANGKSTFLEVLRSLFSAYAAQADFATFLTRSYDTVRNDLARLTGARFVTAIEAGSGRHLDEVLIKQLTGGDRVTARYLYQEFFEFQPQLKLFLATNYKH